MNNNPELKSWFDDAIKQGHTIEELIPHLKEHGYTDEMINPVVAELNSELQSNLQETSDETIVNQTEADSEQLDNQVSEVESQDQSPDEMQTAEVDQDQNQTQTQTQEAETSLEDQEEELKEDITAAEGIEERQQEEGVESQDQSPDEMQTAEVDQDQTQEAETDIDQELNQEDLEKALEESSDDKGSEIQNDDEMSLEEIEEQLDIETVSAEESSKAQGVARYILPTAIIILVAALGFILYPKVTTMIQNISGSQSTPKSSPPVVPGNTFSDEVSTQETDEGSVQGEETEDPIQNTFTQEDTSAATSGGQEGDGPRKFNQDLYFK